MGGREASPEKMAATLERLAAALRVTGKEQLGPRVVVGRPVEDNRGGWRVIPVEHIAYAFRGSMAHENRIGSQLPRGVTFDPDGVYVRTAKGVFLTRYATFQALETLLPPERFGHLHRSIVVNRRWPGLVMDLERTVKVPVAGGGLDVLHGSRRKFEEFTEWYGLNGTHFK